MFLNGLEMSAGKLSAWDFCFHGSESLPASNEAQPAPSKILRFLTNSLFERTGPEMALSFSLRGKGII